MKKLFSGFVFFAGIVLILAACTTTSKKSENVAGLSGDSLNVAVNLAQQYVDSGKLAGVSLMVTRNNETALRKTYGYADVQNKIPVEDNTIFRVFSMTKPITTVALMTLYDEGKFKLDDKVADFIPEFAATQVYNAETKTLEPQNTPMTIRHLLTHTSGLTYGWDQKAYVDSLYRVTGASGWDATLADKVKILAGIPLKHQPGTKYEYSVSIDVAGYLVEVISGQPLDVYMKEKIFSPLKMVDTDFYVPEEKHNRLALLYNQGENGTLKGPDDPANDNFKKPAVLFSGGGGLVSTIDDYSRFARMLLNGGELDSARILSDATVAMIMSNQLPEGVNYENGGSYGLGGSVNPEKGHYGWSGAASTHFVVDKNNNMVIIALTQYMPFNIEYALKFVEKVEDALIQ
ncbi:MAG TPA: serine hydrolase [Prolixibacteraceae bacterium]|nr:serine hydrolase [Prolixibacteraceae bacterium]